MGYHSHLPEAITTSSYIYVWCRREAPVYSFTHLAPPPRRVYPFIRLSFEEYEYVY
jgi:hypothetical protein